MKNRVLGLKLKLKLKRKKTKFITGEDPACKKTVVKKQKYGLISKGSSNLSFCGIYCTFLLKSTT